MPESIGTIAAQGSATCGGGPQQDDRLAMVEEVQHEGAHPGGVIGKARPANLPAAQERIEFLHRHDPAVYRRPPQPSAVDGAPVGTSGTSNIGLT